MFTHHKARESFNNVAMWPMYTYPHLLELYQNSRIYKFLLAVNKQCGPIERFHCTNEGVRDITKSCNSCLNNSVPEILYNVYNLPTNVDIVVHSWLSSIPL